MTSLCTDRLLFLGIAVRNFSHIEFLTWSLCPHTVGWLTVSGCVGIHYIYKPNQRKWGWQGRCFKCCHTEAKQEDKGYLISRRTLQLIWLPKSPCFLFCLGAFSDEADRWYIGKQAEMNGEKSRWYFSRRWKRWETRVDQIPSLLDILSAASVCF